MPARATPRRGCSLARKTVSAEPLRAAGAASAAATTVAFIAVIVTPLLPAAVGEVSLLPLLGLAVESIAIVVVLIAVAQPAVRAAAAGLFGVLVMAAILVSSLDTAFRTTVDRPFNLADDAGAIGDAYGVVADSIGPVAAATIVLLIVAVLAVGVVGLARAALRVGMTVDRQGARGRRWVTVIAGVWIVTAVAHTQVLPGAPVAASRTSDALWAVSERAITSVRDLQVFELALASDPMDGSAPAGLLSALAGKDVVIAFVESYGKVAIEQSDSTAVIDRTLADGDAALTRGGYTAQSAFLTSPTFGGVSWLAHSTLQSGVWVDSLQKYSRLMAGERQTLSSLFAAAGWRTAAVIPSNKRAWPEGEAFYGYDSVLDQRGMGYSGPPFGYAAIPDQFTWRVFHDRFARASTTEPAPLMAEVDLVSSHTPWAPLPHMVDWSQLGDGTVFTAQAAAGDAAADVWADPARIREAYAESIAYSLDATFSYLESFDQPDLVLVLLGDHQPSRVVSGDRAGYEVPVTIIAKDPAVFDRVATWGWDAGVRPSSSAPVWRMDAFRDRFVDAFSG